MKNLAANGTPTWGSRFRRGAHSTGKKADASHLRAERPGRRSRLALCACARECSGQSCSSRESCFGRHGPTGAQYLRKASPACGGWCGAMLRTPAVISTSSWSTGHRPARQREPGRHAFRGNGLPSQRLTRRGHLERPMRLLTTMSCDALEISKQTLATLCGHKPAWPLSGNIIY